MDQQGESMQILADKDKERRHKNHESYLDKKEVLTGGIKHHVHGDDYQLRLLMLFLWRTTQKPYFAFRLATEVAEAGKFDDVYLQYKQNENNKFKLRLVQVKHTAEKEKKTISESDLIRSKSAKNKFHLEKYLESYHELNRKCLEKSKYSVFSGSQIEDLLICTNIDLGKKLKKNICFQKGDLKDDEILKLNEELRAKYPNAAVYMFKNMKNNNLVNEIKGILSETSDFCKLINQLVEFCTDNQIEKNQEDQSTSKPEKNTDLLHYYYYALTRHVFNIKSVGPKDKKNVEKRKIGHCAKFLPGFIDGKEDISVQKFRDELIKKLNIKFSNDKNTKILDTVQLRFSEKIRDAFIPEANPEIENMTNFVDKIKNIINQSDNKVIKISDNDPEFMKNVRKLADYILITKYNKIHFSTSFLDEDNLPGNLNEFRTKLKELLGDETFCSLYEYDIEINDKEFKTCEEGALDRKLPILAGDTEVQEFFSKFKIVVNYPNADDINNVIGEEMQDLFKRLNVNENKSFYMEKLFDWLKERKSHFFTKENTKTLFDEINRKINYTKMEGVTKSYFDKTINEYEEYSFIEYKLITNFLQNTEKQILHLIFNDLNLGRARVFQTFQYLRKQNNVEEIRKYILESGYIFIKLDQLENIVVDCFNDNKINNLLMIECNKNMETDMTNELLKALSMNKLKKIIFITQKNFKLSEQITNFIKYVDESNFSDLDESSKKQLLDRKIMFQAQNITLKELLNERPGEYIDSEVLSELIKNNEITIDCHKSANLDAIREYFIDREYDLYINNEVKKNVIEGNKSDLFVITNIGEDDIRNLIRYWDNYEGTILYKIFFFQLLMLFEIHRKKLIDIKSSLETTDFKIIHYTSHINKIKKHYFLGSFIIGEDVVSTTDQYNRIFYEKWLRDILLTLFEEYDSLNNEELQNAEFIIYTNIGLSSEMLRSDKMEEVTGNDLKEIDDILDFEGKVNGKCISKNYRLISDYPSYLSILLRHTEINELVVDLYRTIFRNAYTNHKKVMKYLWQLDKEIISFTHKKMNSNFIRNENLSAAATTIRELFLCFVQANLEEQKCILSIDEIWKMVEEKLSNQNTLPNILNAINSNPKFVDLNAFTEKIIELLNIGSHDNSIKIILDKNILGSDLDNLAVHILVLKYKGCDVRTFKFSSHFLDTNSNLSDNLQKFRISLVKQLHLKGINLSDMENYVFEIEDFVTCIDKNENLPNDLFSEFLKKLVFRVEQPNEYELIKIVDDKLGYSFFSCESKADNILNPKCKNEKKNILLEHNLLTIFLKKIKENQCKNFLFNRVSYSSSDLNFKFTDREDQTKQFYIQLIQSDDTEINYNNFSKCLNLYALFFSYCEAEERHKFEVQFKYTDKANIEKLCVIFTHLSFDFENLKLHNIHLEEVNEMDDILDMGNGFRLILDEQHQICKDLMSNGAFNRRNVHLKVFFRNIIIVKVPLEFQGATREIEYQYLKRIYVPVLRTNDFNKFFESETYACMSRMLNEEDLSENKPIQIIWSKDPQPQGLTQLFENYSKYNIHYLKKENDKYLWQASRGALVSRKLSKSEFPRFKLPFIHNYFYSSPPPLPNLRKFIMENAQAFKSNKITDRVVIIAADPGMGKSTLLQYLTENIKASYPNKWVIKIDLINCQKQLDEAEGKFDNTDKIISFIYSVLGLTTLLERKFLLFQLEKLGNIILLFDGFDEIDDNNRQKVITLLQALKKYKVEKMWLTTRLHFKIMIEDELEKLSYNLKPFTDEDQKHYLKKFWMKTFNLNISDTDDEPIKNCITKLVDSFKEATNQKERDFLGIPLQSKLLAEAFQENFWEYYNATLQNKETEIKFPKIINVLGLYKRFIAAKYEIYFKTKTEPIRSKGNKSMLIEKYTNLHHRIAVKLLFPNNINFIEESEITSDEADVLKQIGILQSQDMELHFIHRTFAEYFAADQIAKLLEKDKNDLKYKKTIELLKEEFFKEKREVIVKFIDHILVESQPILNAIVNNNENFFKNNKFETCTLGNICDVLGRSPIHLAAAFNYNDINDILMHTTKKVNNYDNLNWSPLQYAIRNSNWRIAELLLKGGANPLDITKAINFKSSDENGVTLLHFCAMQTTVEIVKSLLDREIDIDICDKKGLTPLFYAIKGKKEDITKYLINMKADVNIADQDGLTPIFYAINADNLSIIEYLINSNADMNAVNKEGLNIISFAQKQNNFNIATYLKKKL